MRFYIVVGALVCHEENHAEVNFLINALMQCGKLKKLLAIRGSQCVRNSKAFAHKVQAKLLAIFRNNFF